MTRQIKAIFFDLGDTLIDFASQRYDTLFRAGARLAYKYLKDKGFRLPTETQYVNMHWFAIRMNVVKSFLCRREFNSRNVMIDCCKKLNIPADKDLILEICWQFYQPLMKTASCEPNLPETLAELNQAGLKLCVVSNTFVPGEILDRHLEVENLLQYLPDRVYSCDTGCQKPQPEIFHFACDKMSIAPEQVIFVGDKPKFDIKGANRVGMVSVLKDPTGKHPRPRFKPTHKISQIADLHSIINNYR